MKEKVLTFGEGNQLVGVVTEPEGQKKIEDAPAVLILHSGMHHHVGPFRLHVVTARRLADCGYTVFRFDVAGMGDSPARKDTGYDADRTIADIRSAMDALTQKKGTRRFVMMGLCTGANNAHKVAVVDDRVDGCVFLSGYSYPTWQFYIRRYGAIVLNPGSAMSAVLKRVRNAGGIKTTGDVTTVNRGARTSDGFHWWVLPPKHKTRSDFVKLVDRGVNMLFVFSGAESRRYNYNKQMEHSFPSVDFKGYLKVLINKDAHHAYLLSTDRDKLIKQVSHWLNERYAG